MRQRMHQLVGLLFWLLMFGMWVMLAQGGRASGLHIVDSAQYIAGIGGAVLALTFWWIRHNVGIHRRKGPRQGRRVIAPRIDVDRLGRELRWSVPGGHPGAVTEPHLIVELNEHGAKTYRCP